MKRLYLIPTTHWDREWYFTFQRFRQRLVKMMDELLEIMEKNLEFKYFVLDGQVIPLYDYLEIKPENEKRIRRLVKERRLLIGPFFILPDEFLISGESHIRNLLIGYLKGERFGEVMKFGYIPDPFGHISQMPQVLRGFGIEGAYFMRGRSYDKPMEFYWEAPDGSRVLCVNQNYCCASHLPEEEKAFRRRVRDILEGFLPRMKTPLLVLNNGCDHLFPQEKMPEMIKKFNKKEKSLKIFFSNFEEFFKDLKEKVEENGIKLPIEKGEMRENLNHAEFLLYGILSTRIYLKQENFKCERELEKYAEPLSTFLYSFGEKYPENFLEKSWEWLIKNHPHDSISGCSVDEVHEQMLTRFSWSQEIAESVRRKAFNAIAKRINTQFLKEREKAIIFYNPTQWEVKESVITEIDIPEMERIGFRTPKGKEIPWLLLDKEEKTLFEEREEDIGIRSKKGKRYKVALKMDKIPPFGYNTLVITSKDNKLFPIQGKADPYCMENEYLKIKFNRNGSFDLISKETGVEFHKLHIFEDSGDAGDEYNWSPPQKDSVYTTEKLPAKIEVVQENPIIKVRKVVWRFSLPVSLRKNRKGRSKRLKKCVLTSTIMLRSGSKRVEVETEIFNKVKDHRLRVSFQSGEKVNFSFAEGQFDVVRRGVSVHVGKDYVELPPTTHPQQNFVYIEGGKKRLTIINEGLPEYEVTPNGKIYLTLLRGVGWLSREDLLSRAGNAGPSLETPGAQMLGKWNFKYAIFGEDKASSLSPYTSYHASHLSNFPPISTYTGKHNGEMPSNFSFFRIISPDSLIFSCLKKKEKEEGIVLRAFNPLDRNVESRVEFSFPIKKAYIANLKEEIIKPLQIKDGVLSLKVLPKKIITLLLYTGKGVFNEKDK